MSVFGGDQSTFALMSDGTLWAWGFNYYGVLGTGDTSDRHSPTQIGADNDWVSVTGGWTETFALKSGGTLWAWGYNAGNNTPTRVGTDNEWTSVAMGDTDTVALKSDGSLWAWGYNGYGELGTGDTVDRTAPTQIGADNNWSSVATGDFHTIARKTDGSLWAWGYNGFGQLGTGDTGERNAPVQVLIALVSSSTGNGTITPSSSSVFNGGSATFTITPSAGYTLSNLTDNGANVTQSAIEGGNYYTYTIANITSNHSIQVSFGLPFTDSCSSSGNGTITSSSKTDDYGGTVTFSITPSAGYHLSSLTDNGVDVTQTAVWNGSVYTYTISDVTSNNTVLATFAIGAPPPPPAAPVPALSTAGSVLLMLALGGILWRRRSRSQNARTTFGHGME